MNAAIGTKRFVLHKRTLVTSFSGISDQIPAVIAQCFPVIAAAVKHDHISDNLLFVFSLLFDIHKCLNFNYKIFMPDNDFCIQFYSQIFDLGFDLRFPVCRHMHCINFGNVSMEFPEYLEFFSQQFRC